MKAIEPKSDSCQNRRFGVNKRCPKRYKKVHRPKIVLLGQKQRGARRLDMKNAGVKKSPSFIWTLVVNGNGKGKREYGSTKRRIERRIGPYRAM